MRTAPASGWRSVLAGAVPAPALPTDSLAPVRLEVRKQLENALDAATPLQRRLAEARGGWQDQIASERAGQYQRADEGALALPSARDTDSRAEAVRGAKAANAGKAEKLQLQELAAQTRSAKEFAVDTYSALGQGLVTVPQLAANVIAPGSALAERLRTEMKALQNAESDTIAARAELMRMSAQEREGFAGKYAETAYQLVANPSLGLQEFVRQVPMIVAMVGSGGLGALGGRAAVGAAGRVAPTVALGEAISGGALAAKAAQVGGTAGAVAAASTMSAGDAAGSTYERLMDARQTPESMLRSNPDYLYLVDELGMEPGQARREIAESKSRLSAVLAAPLGVLGFVGAEATLVKRLMGEQSSRFGATQAGKMVAKDNLGEQAEEGGTQVASNYSIGQVDSTQSLMQGVPEAMATAAVTSAPFAAGTAAMQMQAQPSAAPALGVAGAQSAALDAWGRYSPKQGGYSVASLPEVSAPPVAPPTPVQQAQAASAQAMAGIGAAATVDEAIGAATAAVDFNQRAVNLQSNDLLAQALAQANIEAAALSAPPAPPVQPVLDPLAAAPGTMAPAAAPQEVVWTGRRGDGYATPEDAGRALNERERLRPAFAWTARQNPDGRFVLVGLPREAAPAQPLQATQPSAAPAADLQPRYATQAQAQAALQAAGIPSTLAQVAQDSAGGFTIAPTQPQETIRELRDKADALQRLQAALERTGTDASALQLYSPRGGGSAAGELGVGQPGRGADGAGELEVGAAVADIGNAAQVAFGWRPIAVTGLGQFFGVQYGGRVFVDVGIVAGNADSSQAPQALVIHTVGHETTHNLEKSKDPQDQADYEVLRKAILQSAKPDRVSARVQAEGRGRTYGENEIVADVSATFWLDPQFWQRLYDLDSAVMRRIAYKFMENAAKLVQVVKGSRLDAGRFINNVEQVREVAAQVWASRATRGGALFPAAASQAAQGDAAQYTGPAVQPAPNEEANDPTDRNRDRTGRGAGGSVARSQVAAEQPGQTGRGAGPNAQRAADGRLEGAPSVRGFSGPDPRLVGVAEQYARSIGLKLKPQAEYARIDAERAQRIATAYAQMEHAPQDPQVKAAYANLIRQTTAQYRALEQAGYKFWFIDLDSAAGQAYASTPWNAMRDIRANQSMGIFSTADGFGSGDAISDNPLESTVTPFRWPVGGPDGAQTAPVLANDLFRAVHDAFGHGLEGAGFRAEGEENAWQAHVRLFTGSAVGAITSETRGQNSWLNFGPNGEANRTAQVEDTVFADQKTGLMPEWTWTDGRVGDGPVFSRANPLLDTVDPAEAQARVRRREARQPGVGAPQNPRTVLGSGDSTLVVGQVTVEDWLARAERALPGPAMADARRWYEQLHDFLGPIYGEQAERYALAWLLSQQRTSPSKGMMDVLRASDLVGGKPRATREVDGQVKELRAGLNEDGLLQALTGIYTGNGVGSKLMDFVDSEMGKSTRTVVRDDPRGRQPAAIDVWAFRDIGFVDDTVHAFIRKKFGAEAADSVRLDAANGEPQYERGIDFYNDVAQELNRRGLMDGGWTAAQVQAVGWVSMQHAMGIQAEFVRDIVGANTRRVSIGLAPGEGSPLAGRLMGKEIAPAVAQQVVAELAERAGVKVLGNVAGVGAYLQYVEGAVQVEAFSSPEAVLDFMDILGYALQQTEVIATRALLSGKRSAIDLYGEDFGDTAKAQAWFAAFVRAQGDKVLAPGFQQVEVNGRKGVRLVNFSGIWKGARLESLLDAAAQASGVQIDEHRDFKLNLESTKNDWTTDQEGSQFLGALTARGRVRDAQWLAGRYAPSRLDFPSFPRADARAEPSAGAPGKENGLRDGRGRPDAADGGQVGAGNRGNDGPERPSYGRARQGASQAVGAHFSKQVRTELDSRFYGTGMKGEEARRLEGEEDIRHRVFFYVDTGQGVSPEANVGGFAHEVQLNNLYDVLQDALGLVKATRGMGAERANAWERAIVQAGFDGYLVAPDDGPGFAVLVGQHQVPVAPAKPRIKSASAAPQRPAGPQPEVTRAIKDELVRRPVGDEVIQVIRARQAGINLAAPSFKMEFGEARVLASEAAVADSVLAQHPGGFAFGEAPSGSRMNAEDFDFDVPDDVVQGADSMAVMSAYAKGVGGAGDSLVKRINGGALLYADPALAQAAITGQSLARIQGINTSGAQFPSAPPRRAQAGNIPDRDTAVKPLNPYYAGWDKVRDAIVGGHHGVRHWARVRSNGCTIAHHVPGVDLAVLGWFAMLHDAWRHNDDEDAGHGWRAMAHLRKVHGDTRLGLSAGQWWQLLIAIERHSDGTTAADTPTIAACWNADRLDLGRVGITPHERWLCPDALPPRPVWHAMHQRAMLERNKQRRLHAH